MVRAVLDINVFVSALLNDRSVPAKVIAKAERRVFRVVSSPEHLADLDEVLHRPRFIYRYGSSRADRLVVHLRRRASIVHGAPGPLGPLTRDPDDDYLVALYRHANADFLVTGDRDLREAHLPDVRVRTPAEFLAELEMR